MSKLGYVKDMKAVKPQLADEKPKEVIARTVITPTRKYFVPGIGQVTASDLSDVNKQVQKLKKREVQDGNK